MRTKTINILEQILGIDLCYFGLGNNAWNMTPKAQAMKEKIDKFDFIKIITFVIKGPFPESKNMT